MLSYRSAWDETVPEGHHLVDIKITDPSLIATMGQTRAVLANFHVILDPTGETYQTLTKELLGQLKKVRQMAPKDVEITGSDSPGQQNSYKSSTKQFKKSIQNQLRKSPYTLPK